MIHAGLFPVNSLQQSVSWPGKFAMRGLFMADGKKNSMKDVCKWWDMTYDNTSQLQPRAFQVNYFQAGGHLVSQRLPRITSMLPPSVPRQQRVYNTTNKLSNSVLAAQRGCFTLRTHDLLQIIIVLALLLSCLRSGFFFFFCFYLLSFCFTFNRHQIPVIHQLFWSLFWTLFCFTQSQLNHFLPFSRIHCWDA